MKTSNVNSKTAKINQSWQASWILKKFLLLYPQKPADGSGGWGSVSWSFLFHPLLSGSRRVRKITWIIIWVGRRRNVGAQLQSRVLFSECVKIAKSLFDCDDGKCRDVNTRKQRISCDKSNILIRVTKIWMYSTSFYPTPFWDAPHLS